jgi:hypothetical protein
VNFEQLERQDPDIGRRLRERHDVYQGQDYWKSYIVRMSHLWSAPLHYTDEEMMAIRDPVLILAGDRDDWAPIEQAVHMYRTIPQAELAIAPGADHGLYKKIELFTTLVLESDGLILLRRSRIWPKPKTASLEFLPAKLETSTLLLKRKTTRGDDANWTKHRISLLRASMGLKKSEIQILSPRLP